MDAFQPINLSKASAYRQNVDAKLRSYMLKVFNLMSLGVAFTGLVTMLMASSPQLTHTLAVGPLKWVLFFALLGMGFMSGKILTMRSSVAANAFYWIYCALWGVMISPMILYFLRIEGGVWDIARAFFITAGTFAAVSFYGYVTKRDLTPIGNFAIMAVIGIMIAALVNMVFFTPNSSFSMLISVVTVLAFSALTAYETQNIRNTFLALHNDGVAERFAILGAMQLYGNFITLFIHILNLLGMMRSSNN